MITNRLEKIARMLADLHIELSLAAGEGIIKYHRRNQTVILRLQEHCLSCIRIPNLETDHTTHTSNQKPTQ